MRLGEKQSDFLVGAKRAQSLGEEAWGGRDVESLAQKEAVQQDWMVRPAGWGPCGGGQKWNQRNEQDPCSQSVTYLWHWGAPEWVQQPETCQNTTVLELFLESSVMVSFH